MLISLVALAFMVGVFSAIKVNNVLLSSPGFNATMGNNTKYLTTANIYLGWFDWLVVFIAFAMGLAGVISAFMIESHPVFFVMTLLVQIVAVAVSTIFSNVFFTLAGDTNFSSIANSFPLATQLFQNMPIITAVFGIIILIVTHGKPKGAQMNYGI